MVQPLAFNSATRAYEIFDAIQDGVILSGNSALYHLALALGSVFCCAYLVFLSGKIFKGPMYWQPWDVIKPIVVLLLIENFTLVVGAVDGTVGVVCKGIAGYTEDQIHWDIIDGFEDTLDEWRSDNGTVLSDLEMNAEMAADDDSNGGLFGIDIGKWLDKAKDWMFEQVKDFFGITTSFFHGLIAQVIATVAEWIGYIVLLFSRIYLLVLTFIGPFVFAISVIPTFQNGMGQWLARYIQISFWYPILQIINLVYLKFVEQIPQLIRGASNMDELMAANTCSSLIYTLATVAVIFMYFSVPKIAAWLIQSTGTNNAHSNAGKAATAAVATVAKAAI